MAIWMISGVPGAGKTYYAVHHILHTYFTWNEDRDTWIPKDEDFRIISNIENFPMALNLKDLIEAAGGLDRFFNFDYQQKTFGASKLIYLIDEAQHLFPYKFYGPDVFLFFQKHRHLGFDIYMITQDTQHLARGVRDLSEFHVKAVRRSLSFSGEFRYQFVDTSTFEVWRTKVLRPDGRVFAFYRSMMGKETEKLPSVARKYAYMFVGFIVVAAVVFFGRFWGGGYSRAKNANGISPASSGPVAASKVAEIVNEGGEPPLWVSRGERQVVGIFGASPRVYVVADGDDTYRLTEEQMLRACRCRPEVLQPGSVFQFFESGSQQSILVRSVPTRGAALARAPVEAVGGGAGGGVPSPPASGHTSAGRVVTPLGRTHQAAYVPARQVSPSPERPRIGSSVVGQGSALHSTNAQAYGR